MAFARFQNFPSGGYVAKQARAMLGFVLAAVFIAACMPAPEPPFRIGTNVWPGYEPLYLARDLGYLDGHNIRLVEFGSATTVMNALANGAIEAAALTLDEVLLLSSRGIDLRVVLVLDMSNGGDAILARPPLKRMADLKGRRIGVETTALGAYMLSRASAMAGLSTGDYTVVPLHASEHEAAFHAGRVDAVVTFEPVRSQLIASGATPVFDSKNIPGEIVDVLAVRMTPARLPQMQALIRAWFMAVDHLRRQPGDAGRRLAKRLHMAPADVLAAFDGLSLPDTAANRTMLAASSPGLLASAQRLADSMAAQGLAAQLTVPKHLFDARPLAGAVQ